MPRWGPYELFDGDGFVCLCVMTTYLWDLYFVALLEMLGEGIDEFLGGNVLNVNPLGVVDQSKLNL